MNFAFARTYRNQTTGTTPLGPGWDFSYRQRLRPLPNGDVELYDGRGRREAFRLEGDELEAPMGRFLSLSSTDSGYVLLDRHRNQLRFDSWGRLVAMADFVKDDEDTGNEMTFHYDLAGRLVRVRDSLDRDIHFSYNDDGRLEKLLDFDQREVSYEYDPDGRLASVTSPAVTAGESTFPSGLETAYTYSPIQGSLEQRLALQDNLATVKDSRGQEWLKPTFTDADGDGRAEEVTRQTWGEGTLAVAYDFSARTATVTDRRGNTHICTHNETGQGTSYEDPANQVWSNTFDQEGRLTSHIPPVGPSTFYDYDSSCEGFPSLGEGASRRSLGNLLQVRVAAGEGGVNGSPAELLTCAAYHPSFNLPVRVKDPRGAITIFTRDHGLATKITEAAGGGEERITTFDYKRLRAK